MPSSNLPIKQLCAFQPSWIFAVFPNVRTLISCHLYRLPPPFPFQSASSWPVCWNRRIWFPVNGPLCVALKIIPQPNEITFRHFVEQRFRDKTVPVIDKRKAEPDKSRILCGKCFVCLLSCPADHFAIPCLFGTGFCVVAKFWNYSILASLTF